MNSVDWSIYDPQSDVEEKIPKKKKIENLEESKVDWDLYDPPMPRETGILEDVADYGKTALKGIVEGASRFGRGMGPLSEDPAVALGLKQPQPTQEDLTEFLEEKIPTEEGFTQTALRRGLREAPSMMSFPGSALGTLPRSIAAGFLGEGAKELGLPEWAQTAAEITAYIGPDITKKLLEKGKNADIIKEAKKLGFSDEELAPLLNSEFKQKWLSKLSPKRGQTQRALTTTKERLSETYKSIQKGDIASKPISAEAQEALSKGIYDAFEEIPSDLRKKIEGDFLDLLKKPITGETLMNFYADINHNLGNNSKQLTLLKPAVKQAISSISPELAKDFNLVNDLYSKYYTISARLQPNLVTDLIQAGEALGLGASLITGHYPSLIAVLGEKTGKKIAQQLLINPRLHQLSEKIGIALKNNQYGLAQKLFHSYASNIEKTSPEAAKELRKIRIQQIKDFFSIRENEPSEEQKE